MLMNINVLESKLHRYTKVLWRKSLQSGVENVTFVYFVKPIRISVIIPVGIMVIRTDLNSAIFSY